MKKTDKIRRKYPLHTFLEEDETDHKRGTTKICQWEGCDEDGLYPAPKNRDQLRNYYWFCLDHVREYNQNWDYYSGMNPAAIEASRRADVTWDRPSWSFSRSGVGAFLKGDFRDPIGVFEEDLAWSACSEPAQEMSFEPEEIQAMALLNLSYPFSAEQLKVRYKTMAKQYHPDLNQGSKKAEETFKKVNIAYSVLKKNLELLA